MARLHEIIRTVSMTEDERTALAVAVSSNGTATGGYMQYAVFDQEDSLRLVMYRRAVHAGMYWHPKHDLLTPAGGSSKVRHVPYEPVWR